MKKKEVDPTAPGGAEFDVDNASAEDFAKHEEILRRRSVLAGLAAPVQQVALVEAPTATVAPAPDPTDIYAKKNGEGRYFTQITWDLLGEDHAGWEQTVAKPADLS